ncbi:diamine acetyltransferase 1-like [Mizuhopecten yessoensis]|uniref:Diamine acetyltransferase 1 n=1 Tax=Mizuhopecten yessoensis TaxID=6573 RepID=A0A210Q6T7_MIZYE|nr:diamine acetyltransferase 1-like [Mizuhopecten yessoensis]OWF44450.1 Diamine acetyltransferase 1 [Mizuhopecten yessoensis]
MTDYKIRPAVEDDVEEILRLIQEFTEYLHVKIPEQLETISERLRRDGFGEQKCFEYLVVEDTTAKTAEGKTVLLGFALYFYTYATLVGRIIYLEDLFLSEAYRGRGIGAKLFKTVAQIGTAHNCQKMQWVAHTWNKPSIEFYKKQGAVNMTEKEKWNIFQLTRPESEQLSKKQ